jgi:hypothetical protein
MPEEITTIPRPKSPSAIDTKQSGLTPADYNPELAAAQLVREVVARFPQPAIISKEFAVYQGIWKALNDTPENHTGYDCKLRLMVYEEVSRMSVNVDGFYPKNLWAYLMKPKYIIQGMPMQGSNFEEDKPGFLSRLWSGITGGGKKEGEGT